MTQMLQQVTIVEGAQLIENGLNETHQAAVVSAGVPEAGSVNAALLTVPPMAIGMKAQPSIAATVESSSEACEEAAGNNEPSSEQEVTQQYDFEEMDRAVERHMEELYRLKGKAKVVVAETEQPINSSSDDDFLLDGQALSAGPAVPVLRLGGAPGAELATRGMGALNRVDEGVSSRGGDLGDKEDTEEEEEDDVPFFKLKRQRPRRKQSCASETPRCRRLRRKRAQQVEELSSESEGNGSSICLPSSLEDVSDGVNESSADQNQKKEEEEEEEEQEGGTDNDYVPSTDSKAMDEDEDESAPSGRQRFNGLTAATSSRWQDEGSRQLTLTDLWKQRKRRPPAVPDEGASGGAGKAREAGPEVEEEHREPEVAAEEQESRRRSARQKEVQQAKLTAFLSRRSEQAMDSWEEGVEDTEDIEEEESQEQQQQQEERQEAHLREHREDEFEEVIVISSDDDEEQEEEDRAASGAAGDRQRRPWQHGSGRNWAPRSPAYAPRNDPNPGPSEFAAAAQNDQFGDPDVDRHRDAYGIAPPHFSSFFEGSKRRGGRWPGQGVPGEVMGKKDLHVCPVCFTWLKESLTTTIRDPSSIDPLDILTSRGGSNIIDDVDAAAAVSFTSKAELVKHLATLHGIQGASSRTFTAVLDQHKLRSSDGLAQKWLHRKGEQHIIKTNEYWFRYFKDTDEVNRKVFLAIHDVATNCESDVAPGERRKLFPTAKYDEESLETWNGLVAPEAGGESLPLSGDDGFLDDEEEQPSGFSLDRDEERENEEEAEIEEMVAGLKRRASSGRRGSRSHHVVADGDDSGGGGGDAEDRDDDDDGGDDDGGEGLENSKDGWGSRGSSSSSDGVQSDGEAVQVDNSPDALDMAERRLMQLKREKRRRKKERQRHAEMEQGVPAPGGTGAVRRSTRTRRLRRVSKISISAEEEEDRPQQGSRQMREGISDDGGDTDAMVKSENISGLADGSSRPAPSTAQQRCTGRVVLTDSEDSNDT